MTDCRDPYVTQMDQKQKNTTEKPIADMFYLVLFNDDGQSIMTRLSNRLQLFKMLLLNFLQP